jgi:hypothetical protein
VTDVDRCPKCGVAFGPMDHGSWYELDTGEHHIVERCRDYLFAEVERMRKVLEMWSEHWDCSAHPGHEEFDLAVNSVIEGHYR